MSALHTFLLANGRCSHWHAHTHAHTHARTHTRMCALAHAHNTYSVLMHTHACSQTCTHARGHEHSPNRPPLLLHAHCAHMFSHTCAHAHAHAHACKILLTHVWKTHIHTHAEQVPLPENLPHAQLVLCVAPALDAARQVYGAEEQGRLVPRCQVHLPALAGQLRVLRIVAGVVLKCARVLFACACFGCMCKLRSGQRKGWVNGNGRGGKVQISGPVGRQDLAFVLERNGPAGRHARVGSGRKAGHVHEQPLLTYMGAHKFTCWVRQAL